MHVIACDQISNNGYKASMKRQVWQTNKAGAIDRLKLLSDDLGLLEQGNIRVEVRAVGLNFADIFAITGLYSATPKGAFVPGLEFSGVVAEVSGINNDYSVGDKVMGVSRFGGYATLIDSAPEYLTPLPKSWTFEQGAAYLVQTLTAYYALTDLGNIKTGHSVLIHSAAGGVGLQAMKLVQLMGGSPIGTVGSQGKKAFLQTQGFTDVYVRSKVFKQQLEQDKRHFDLVLDGVGGAVQKASFDHLNPMGRLVVFGAAEFTPGKNRPQYLKAALQYIKRPKYDVMNMISDNKSVMAFNLIWLWQQVAYLTELIKSMQEYDISPPHVGHVYSFDDAHSAIQCLRKGQSIGKVVLKVKAKAAINY